MALVSEWSGILSTTIHDFIREQTINILRNRKLLAMMKEHGRISFNHSGDAMQWPVKYKRNGMVPYTDGDTLTFTSVDRFKTAQLEWRGYAQTEALTKKRRLMNRGEEAIVNILEEMTTNQMQDIEDNFAQELYNDGYATGYTDRIHGLESFMGTSGAAAAGYIGVPSDTYAQLSTTLGNYGGSWSTSGGNVIWPLGSGDAQYDFWSPLILKYQNSSWSSTTDTWQNNAQEVMRFAIVHGNKDKNPRGAMNLFLLDREMYRLFLNTLDSKERIIINKGGSGKLATLSSLGFTGVTWFDGVEITSEYGIPDNVGYGLNLDSLELRSMQAELFVAEEPDYDTSSKTLRYSVDAFCNLRANPRGTVKLVA